MLLALDLHMLLRCNVHNKCLPSMNALGRVLLSNDCDERCNAFHLPAVLLAAYDESWLAARHWLSQHLSLHGSGMSLTR